MDAMSFAMVRTLSSSLLEKMDLYRPRCLPEGEVVVDSRQYLNSPCRSSVVIDCFRLSHSFLHSCITNWVVASFVIVSGLLVPSRMDSASCESAAQFRLRSVPMVKGVPVHWLKWFWFLCSMAASIVCLSYIVSVVPLVVVRCTNVTPGFGGLRIQRSLA